MSNVPDRGTFRAALDERLKRNRPAKCRAIAFKAVV
jgi:hypothetical protein